MTAWILPGMLRVRRENLKTRFLKTFLFLAVMIPIGLAPVLACACKTAVEKHACCDEVKVKHCDTKLNRDASPCCEKEGLPEFILKKKLNQASSEISQIPFSPVITVLHAIAPAVISMTTDITNHPPPLRPYLVHHVLLL